MVDKLSRLILVHYFTDMLKIHEKGIFGVQANAHHKFGIPVLRKMYKKCIFYDHTIVLSAQNTNGRNINMLYPLQVPYQTYAIV